MGCIFIYYGMDRFVEGRKEMEQWDICCVVVGFYWDFNVNGRILMWVEGRE